MLNPARDVYLDLGAVDYIAQVKVNDADLGILWKPPFRIRITPALLPEGLYHVETQVEDVFGYVSEMVVQEIRRLLDL